MRVLFSERSARSFREAPDRIQRDARGIWQARINGGWRFYFTIEGDLYILLDMIPHPK